MPSAIDTHGVILPALVDQIAQRTPTRVWGSVPKSKVLSEGWRDITFAEFSTAINRLCAFIEPHIGTSQRVDGSRVVYVGLNDPRYIMVALALLKLGHTAVLSAPRNTLPMHLNLIKQTNCTALLYAPGIDPSHIKGERKMKIVQIPSLVELLDDVSPAPPAYPYTRTYSEIKQEPYIFLHTSGSTGMPQPVKITHGYVTTVAHIQNFTQTTGAETTASLFNQRFRVYTSFPIWHMGGMVLACVVPSIFGEATAVFGPPDLPPTGPVALEVLKYSRAEATCLVPSSIQGLTKLPEGLDWLKKMKFVMYGGGSLDKVTGEIVSKLTLLRNTLGSTETMTHGIILVDRDANGDAWEYIHFSPDDDGLEFQEISPGIFELILVRTPRTEHLYAVWQTFPHANRYPTKDLLRRHPDPKKATWYRHESRTDDLIVFSSGAKYNPLSYEDEIRSNPLISAALVVGTMRPHPVLLLEVEEPFPTKAYERAQLLEKLWPVVEETNLNTPNHGIIRKEMILLTNPSQPMQRTSKGTVVRHATQKIYQDEIDDIYKRHEI